MPQTPFAVVVFDMDGLMLDTEALYVQVSQRLCARWGREYTSDMQNAMAGVTGDQSLAIMLDMLGVEADLAEVCEASSRMFLELVETDLRPMPGLMDLLGRLEQARMRKAVATSTPRDLTGHLLAKLDLGARFELIRTGDDVTHCKPDPEIYQLAARRLGVKPAEMLVLEDSYNGMLSATAAGAFCVAVPAFFARGRDFSRADLVVDSLAHPELSRLLGV